MSETLARRQRDGLVFFLGVAQSAQSSRFGTERSQVRILSPRPHASIAQLVERNRAMVEVVSASLIARSKRCIWVISGGLSLMGKAPGREPGRCEFDSRRSPQIPKVENLR